MNVTHLQTWSDQQPLDIQKVEGKLIMASYVVLLGGFLLLRGTLLEILLKCLQKILHTLHLYKNHSNEKHLLKQHANSTFSSSQVFQDLWTRSTEARTPV